MSDFVDDYLSTVETKSDRVVATAPTTQEITAADINLLSTSDVSLRAAILSSKYSNVYGVTRYGATGNGSTDDTSAIQSAINAARGTGGTVHFPPGQYKITSSLNCTGITGGICLRGDPGATTQLKCAVGGKAILDFTGSLFCRADNLWIEGDATTTPAAAILVARSSGNASAGSHIFRGLIIRGSFTKAPVVSISSESNEYVNCDIQNAKAGAHGVYVTDQNTSGITSDYATFPATWTGGNTVHRFFGGRISVIGGAGTEKGLILRVVRDISLHGTYFDGTNGDTCISVDGDVTGLAWHGASAESQAMNYTLTVRSGVTLANLDVVGVVAYKPIYSETTGIIRHSNIRGQFYGSPYGVDADILENSTASVATFSIRARTSAASNTFIGTGDPAGSTGQVAALVSLPTDSRGNTYITDVIGGDGRRRTVTHLGDQGLYSEASGKWMSADLFKTRCVLVTASSYPGGYQINLNTGGAFVDITLDADLVLSDLSANGPIASAGTKDEGARLTLLIRQTAGGGHYINGWPTTLKSVAKVNVRAGANDITIASWIFDKAGFWILESLDGAVIYPDRYIVAGLANPVSIVGSQADGASSVGVTSGTGAAYTTAGAKIHRFENNAVEKANVDKDGSFVITSSAHNLGHLVLGIYHLWMDSSGRLRVKSSAPSSDTDGTVVGTQT